MSSDLWPWPAGLRRGSWTISTVKNSINLLKYFPRYFLARIPPNSSGFKKPVSLTRNRMYFLTIRWSECRNLWIKSSTLPIYIKSVDLHFGSIKRLNADITNLCLLLNWSRANLSSATNQEEWRDKINVVSKCQLYLNCKKLQMKFIIIYSEFNSWHCIMNNVLAVHLNGLYEQMNMTAMYINNFQTNFTVIDFYCRFHPSN